MDLLLRVFSCNRFGPFVHTVLLPFRTDTQKFLSPFPQNDIELIPYFLLPLKKVLMSLLFLAPYDFTAVFNLLWVNNSCFYGLLLTWDVLNFNFSHDLSIIEKMILLVLFILKQLYHIRGRRQVQFNCHRKAKLLVWVVKLLSLSCFILLGFLWLLEMY
jgi:hypothetical protein